MQTKTQNNPKLKSDSHLCTPFHLPSSSSFSASSVPASRLAYKQLSVITTPTFLPAHLSQHLLCQRYASLTTCKSQAILCMTTPTFLPAHLSQHLLCQRHASLTTCKLQAISCITTPTFLPAHLSQRLLCQRHASLTSNCLSSLHPPSFQPIFLSIFCASVMPRSLSSASAADDEAEGAPSDDEEACTQSTRM